jgi:hypothetical protein
MSGKGLPPGYGYALIRRGGCELGKRPLTRMAWLTRPTPGGWLGYIGNEALDGWTLRARPIADADVVKRWKTVRPSRAAIRKAKAVMPVSE